MSQVPVFRNIPLPLPAPEWLLVTVLVIFFLMHIVFVNFMIGGSFLTTWYQIKGLRDPKYDRLAYRLAESITVNKSVAVVLGIGPLLAINVLYTGYFYSANALTGAVWISIIPTIAGAFLLTYAHKYLWCCMERFKGLHIALGALASLIFLWVPLVFLTNVNLMLQPGKWLDVQGFVSALTLPNVFPRYAHFLTACVALTGLYMVWSFRNLPAEESEALGISRGELVRKGYRWLFWPTMAQFIVGPTVLLTLPEPGISGAVLPLIGSGVIVAAVMMIAVMGELRSPEAVIGRRFVHVSLLMTVVLLCMGAGRHAYRVEALAAHQKQVAAATEAYTAEAAAAKEAAKAAVKEADK